MNDLEKFLKALANKRRLEILKLLKTGKRYGVVDIAQKINCSYKAVSKHLGILHSVGILEREQAGFYMIYRIAKRQKSIVKSIIAVL